MNVHDSIFITKFLLFQSHFSPLENVLKQEIRFREEKPKQISHKPSQKNKIDPGDVGLLQQALYALCKEDNIKEERLSSALIKQFLHLYRRHESLSQSAVDTDEVLKENFLLAFFYFRIYLFSHELINKIMPENWKKQRNILWPSFWQEYVAISQKQGLLPSLYLWSQILACFSWEHATHTMLQHFTFVHLDHFIRSLQNNIHDYLQAVRKQRSGKREIENHDEKLNIKKAIKRQRYDNILSLLETDPLAAQAILNSALCEAIQCDDKTAVQLCIDWGADVNAVVEERGLPVSYAVSHKKTEIIPILLNNGANIHFTEKSGYGFHLLQLSYESEAVCVQLLKTVIAAGANVYRMVYFDGESLLLKALMIHYFALATFILQQEDVAGRCEKIQQYLHVAIIRNNMEMFDYLYRQKEADINAIHHQGYTLLITAAAAKKAEFIYRLLPYSTNLLVEKESRALLQRWEVSETGIEESKNVLSQISAYIFALYGKKEYDRQLNRAVALQCFTADFRQEIEVAAQKFLRAVIFSHFPAQLLALIIFMCDGLLKPRSDPDPILSKPLRFFSQAEKLPMELQMVLCHRVFGSADDLIKKADREEAFKKLANPASHP